MTTISGDSTNNVLSGTTSADTISGGGGNDAVYAGDGNDRINAGSGNDFVDGGAGDDRIDAGSGNDTVMAGIGNDVVDGGKGDDSIDGGAGDDRIDAGSGNDTVMAGIGNDVVDGGSGNDTVYGGDGSDRIDGESGNDVIYGDAGNDRIDGGSGNDTLMGGIGDDVLSGSAGNDTLSGGDGNDILVGGAGTDQLTGGLGNDTFVYLSASDARTGTGSLDSILDFTQGSDKIDLTAFRGAHDLNWSGTTAGKYGVWFINHPDSGGSTGSSISVNADTNGDGIADLTIELKNTLASLQLTSADFIGVNSAPSAVADTASGTENQTLTIDVLANDRGSGNDGRNDFDDRDDDDHDGHDDCDDDDDHDEGDGHVFTLVSVAAPAGKGMANMVNNQVVFNPGTDFDHLAQGATEHVILTYTMQDEHGAKSSSMVDVTVTGTNDDPVISGTALGAAQEDVALSATGQLSALDIDDGATQTWTIHGSPTGAYGSISVDSSGKWTYTLDNGTDGVASAVQSLAKNESVTDSFTVRVTDDKSGHDDQTVTVTITGTNDAPVAVVDDNRGDAVSEAGVHPGNRVFAGDDTAVGNVLTNDTDVDSGDTKTVSAVNDVGANVNNSVAGTYGSVVIHADGSYTYTLNNADPDTNALAQDASVDDVFNYTMQDASGAASSSTLTISITGTNDAPVANPDTNRGDPVTEAGVHPGNTVFADDDTAVGDVLANDTDVDFGDTKTVTAVNGSPGSVFDPVHGAYGSVIIRDDGSWIYTLDNTDPDTNALAQGASATDIFRYTMEDANGASSSSTLTIHITGTNDAPVANPDDATAVDDGNVTLPDAIGNVLGNDRDPDTGDILMGVTAVNGNPNVVGDPVRGTYGSVNILDDGSWKYYLNDHATDALARGTSADDVFAYTTEDANGASSSSTLTIHVTGTGAAPVVTSLTSTAGNLSVTGGASAGGGNNAPVAVADEAIFKTTGTSGNVLANDFDPDTGDSLVVTGVSTSGNPGTLFDPFDPVHGTYGSITIRDDGSWDYTLDKNDPDTNALAQGASVDDVFGYTIEDPYGATASSTLLIHIDVL